MWHVRAGKVLPSKMPLRLPLHCMHVCSPPSPRSNTLGNYRLRLASSLGKWRTQWAWADT